MAAPPALLEQGLSGFWFSAHMGPNGKRPRAAVSRWMAKAQKRAGLPVTRALHILRHTFCSRLAMRGVPAKASQELAGHENLSTTQRYMHLSPAAKDAAIGLLDDAASQISGDILETEIAAKEKPRG
jgi:site-specific recombinase XerD